ncbi:ATP-binding protein [Actinophytocola glycyrrhizae]|uniref:ATP-binding protein n=1 Tax=Actinophytocola glycyrrhizae TaxID=2044873 RepID=A0ABV9S134_9PSEU
MHENIELQDHISILAPTGTLDEASADVLRDRLLAAAAAEPRAVLVEITELELPGLTTLFDEVAEATGRWPGVPLLVVDPRGRLQGDLAHRTVAEALSTVGNPPARRLARRELPNTRMGGRAGRAFVRDCCRRWHVEEPRAADAVWVANELVENTIRHTPYQPSLRVELRHGELTVAVIDDDPTPPKPDPTKRPLHGLGAVHRLAAAWGTTPTARGGKVVWAAL